MNDSESRAPVIQDALPVHIVAMNYFSLLFLATGCVGSWYFSGGKMPVMFVFCLLWVYLVPPMLCRVTIMCCGRPSGIVRTSSKTHSLWWLLMQYQLLFNRFPVLEEILRVIPGLYAVWLNAWGAKVDPFTFWSPGTTVMDRYHLNIERGVILGTQCLLSGHLIVKQPDGSTLLITGPITLRAGALVGARAMVPPGSQIHTNQTVPTNRQLKPYSVVEAGKVHSPIYDMVRAANL